MLGLARIVWRLRPRGRRQILLIAAALFFCYRAALYGDPLSTFFWQYAAIGVWIAAAATLLFVIGCMLFVIFALIDAWIQLKREETLGDRKEA